MRRRETAWLLGMLALPGGALHGCAPPAKPLPRGAVEAPVTPAQAPDYLLVAPRAYHAALAPLVAHREDQGHVVALVAREDIAADGRDAASIARYVADAHAAGDGRLAHLLLVGDIPREDESAAERMPSFYLRKIDYRTHEHHERHVFHRSLLHVEHDEEAFPSDHPYAYVKGEAAGAQIAVGRLPARSAADVTGFVDKLVRYETAPVTGDWTRRLVVHAGPGDFGAMIDRILESQALELLDERLSPSYDLSVVFAHPSSAYAYPFDALGTRLTHEANRGALFMAYVGHSSPAYFDSFRYRGQRYSMGDRENFERMRIAEGAPFFISFSCDVGAFDMSKGRRSIAEEAVLNPGGPVAAFAATRVSHPYANMLYGQAVIDVMLNDQPATVGEGLSAVRRQLASSSSLIGEALTKVDTGALKREHAALYLLFGDPATRLRYPQPLALTVARERAPGAELRVDVSADAGGATQTGKVVGTTETRRSVIQGEPIDTAAREELPRDFVFEQMAIDHRRANDKVVARADGELGKTIVMQAPATPGDYVVKAFALGGGESAAGAVRVRIVP